MGNRRYANDTVIFGLNAAIKRQDRDYFDKLFCDTKATARDFLLDFVDSQDYIEDIECRRRDGFIPHSWNRGGLEAYVTQDLGYFWGSGATVGIPEAQKVLDKYIESALEDSRKEFIDKNAETLSDLEIKTEDVNYHELQDRGLNQLAEELSELESEFLYGEYASTYHSIRVLYEGEDQWSVMVLHRISDAPYHRTCDGSKEWKFKAKTAKSLARQLKRIKKQVTEAFI